MQQGLGCALVTEQALGLQFVKHCVNLALLLLHQGSAVFSDTGKGYCTGFCRMHGVRIFCGGWICILRGPRSQPLLQLAFHFCPRIIPHGQQLQGLGFQCGRYRRAQGTHRTSASFDAGRPDGPFVAGRVGEMKTVTARKGKNVMR